MLLYVNRWNPAKRKYDEIFETLAPQINVTTIPARAMKGVAFVRIVRGKIESVITDVDMVLVYVSYRTEVELIEPLQEAEARSA